MKKILVLILSAICCCMVFNIYGQRFPKPRKPRLPRENVRIQGSRIGVRPIIPFGVLTRPLNVSRFNHTVPQVTPISLAPRPHYLFLRNLTQLQIDSITEANNKAFAFFSHGIDARKMYHTLTESLDSVALRFNTLFETRDSLSVEEFSEIQANDSILANYIEDYYNGYPEQMLVLSHLLCEVYPHVSFRPSLLCATDFEEVMEKRHEYLHGDTVSFRKIYLDIIERMVELNGPSEF